MADETATIEQPITDESASDWSQLSAEEKTASVAETVEKVREQKYAETEDSDTPVVPQAPVSDDETPVADDSAAEVSDDDKAGWLDEETIGLAAAYGVDKDDLAKMPNREVLESVLKAIDKKAFSATKEETLKETPQKQEAAKAPITVFDDLTNFKLDDELGADDAPKIQKAISAITQELKELREWKATSQQAQTQQTIEGIRSKALDSLHKLGHTDLYGEPGVTPTKEQQARINEVLQDHLERGALLEKRGGKPAPTPELVKRSVFALHGEQLLKTQQQRLADRLRKQSARRTGGGTSKTLPPDWSKMTPRERAIADPKVAKAFADGQAGGE